MRLPPFALLLLLSLAQGADGRVRMIGDLPRLGGAALQDVPDLETEYGMVRMSEGVRLRTIVTRPEGASPRLPAIFLAQAVSCGSIDVPANRPSMPRELARRAGIVLVRVERAGTGDSEGPRCSALDYDTEVRHYREALAQLARHPWIDPGRIIIYGDSLGSTTAPLIAEGHPVAGILVQGGGAVTYLERMINFDRLYLERSGGYAPEQFQDEMLRRIAFHYQYLVRGLTPQEVEAERPELRGTWSSILGAEPDGHYGRPFRWHQQAARRNFLAAWARTDAPVMVVHAQYDQYEPRHGHELIADTVNRLRPGAATFLELPGVDHSLVSYASAEAAYREEGGRMDAELFLQPVLQWLERVLSRPRR